ncbi:MAG: hypothetical protein J6Y02_11860 [Pseudobutyrivibrio sp.]|nr:hypothetical protein [Pseudobutyrivibrio sp.]
MKTEELLKKVGHAFCNECEVLCDGIEKCQNYNCDMKQTYYEIKRRLKKADNKEIKE